MNPNIQILETAVEKLMGLSTKVVFAGGCSTGLLITDPAASPVRVTIDVDVIVEVTSLLEYHLLSDKLRQNGFVEDISDEAPLCRWKIDEIILDVIPTDPNILGFGNRWFAQAYTASEWIRLPSGKQIRLLTAPYFLATKFEAFESRGKNDFLMSHDIEDIVTILDGRVEIISEVKKADTKLKDYLALKCSSLLNNRNFLESLPGHLLPDYASQARLVFIINRIKEIAEFRSII